MHMTDATAIDIAQQALTVAFMISLPALGFGLVVGLIVAVFQAATQIHEATLTFIPKIAAVAVALVIFGPWMLNRMVTFTSNLLENIPMLVK
jgi:flagellar biosynthetic protein FliQ